MYNLNQFISDTLARKESMDSLIIFKNGSGYEVNKKNPDVFDVRSVAKTVLALAVGISISESNGDFSEETLIYPILEKKVKITNRKNVKYLKNIKVKHLLTHTTGYRDLILMSKDINPGDYDKLLEYSLNYPIHYNPGEHFLYSNAGYLILAASMQEYLGYDLFEFINDKLFLPIGINDASWDRYGRYLAGATKLNLSADDLLKIGKVLIDKGKFEGKEIVNSTWIEKMIAPKFVNHNEVAREYLSEDNYGYGIWISDNGIVFASGTGGQLIVLIEKLDTVIVTANKGPDSKSYRIKNDVDKIIETLLTEER